MFGLQFKEWILKENFSQATALFKYKPGDIVAEDDLKKRFRLLAREYHPDNAGDTRIMSQVNDAYKLLRQMIGKKIPSPNWRNWQPRNSVEQFRNDIKNEINRAIAALQKQPQDAYASIIGLIDPNTGKLNNPVPGYQVNSLLKSGLQQWLSYYNKNFHTYLQPILKTALTLI